MSFANTSDNYDEVILKRKLVQLIQNSKQANVLLVAFLIIFTFLRQEYDYSYLVWIVITLSTIAAITFVRQFIQRKIGGAEDLNNLLKIYDATLMCSSACIWYLVMFLLGDFQYEARIAFFMIITAFIPATIAIHGIRIQSFLAYTAPIAFAIVFSFANGSVFQNEEVDSTYAALFFCAYVAIVAFAFKQHGLYTSLYRHEIDSKLKNDKLESLASEDCLTGLDNRRTYDKFINDEWLRHKRTANTMSLLVIDVDNFKIFYDERGHAKGDTCLMRVANVIKKSLKRSSDFACRYGGEEFVVVLLDTALDDAVIVANDILRGFEEEKIEHGFSDVSPYVTVSIGLASVEPAQKNVEVNKGVAELFHKADEQMYKAKTDGKNKLSYAESD